MVKTNKLDSARFCAKQIKLLSEDPAQDFNLQYLLREIEIAQASTPDELDSISPEIPEPLPTFEFPEILIYNAPFCKNSLAEAYLRMGFIDKAIKEYERLTSIDLTTEDRHLVNPRYYYYLGILYQDKGMKEKAAQQFRRFLGLWKDADPGFKEPADSLGRLARLLS